MKKKYIVPTVVAIDIESEMILAASPSTESIPSFDVSKAVNGYAEDAASKDDNQSLWELEE